MKDILKEITSFLNIKVPLGGKEIDITIKTILLLIIAFLIVKFILKYFKKFVKNRLEEEDKNKFNTIFSFASWLLYLIVFSISLSSAGVNLSAILVASSALLIGIGLALQTFFQDIISGVFIILDKSVHVGDIIELDGKVGRVEEIKLRTTRAVTIDNKVLVIPNHKYLTNSLYNWTQNGTTTRENVKIGVAYGSDIQLVKELLLKAAKEHPKVFQHPAPLVVFENFGDSALEFKLIFTLNDSFQAQIPQSEIRFKIDELFRENNISIPFPQRDIHIIKA
ncbi:MULTISPECIES: mechanosensitive ion channel family protein [Tenacibaculum]|uniref:mechanosensitive ion channel family protein n=1 Tax=Tenacibaculum TaxID=104267 RepID=UPI0021AEF462|nr:MULTISPECIES: mechanosensitive ion channel domain-containing protein [Tenacibaculum]MCT4699695.1 mechanosensitive ion channel [Tenacibaculum haliotis]WBX70669.1 mechanosensitive ion channel [Tenacibaculum retecalamus]